MTLMEMSTAYEHSAALLSRRLAELRRMLTQTDDPEVIFALKHRIKELTPMLTQMNELAELTKRYYERGYWRNEKYVI